jgi:anti-sigma-K factor RskA
MRSERLAERREMRAELDRQLALIQTLHEQVESATTTMRLLRNPAIQVVSLGGADPQKEAAGRIFWDRKNARWTLFAANMKPAGEGKTYELWFITADQKKIRAGTFDVDASGEGSLTVRVPEGIGEIALAAVTDEPAGGVDQPTGSIQLVGKVASPPASS